MKRLVLPALASAVVALVAVAAADAVRPDSWTGTGMALSAEGAIAVAADGHDYAVPKDVAWTDVQGAFHMSGRPDCLPPTGKLEGPIRFEAVPVQFEGYSLRQVVHVECLASDRP